MLSSYVAALRQRCARDYILAFEEARGLTWGEARAHQDLVWQLLLCHPGWLPASEKVRQGIGLRRFNLGSERRSCRSFDLWGYECPLAEHSIEADHTFPMALGGPADPTNMVWLCRLHNLWKGCDLFHYPWEDGEPKWLQAQLTRVGDAVEPNARLDV